MSQWLAVFFVTAALVLLGQPPQCSSSSPPSGPKVNNYANLSDFNAWLQARAAQANSNAERLQPLVAMRLAPPSQHRPATVGGGYAIEVTPPPPPPSPDLSSSPVVVVTSSNRSARTLAAVNYDDQIGGNLEIGGGGDSEDDSEYKLIVSNTCERDFMQVEIRTSKPFYGVVHTLNYRRKLICTSEGDGGTQLRLAISHALNPNDPQHCGVTRLAAAKPIIRPTGTADGGAERGGELLSVIVAVRLHRNIELSEDRFFALNCTNRCRRPDCSSGQLATGKLINAQEATKRLNSLRQLEREQATNEESSNLLPGGRSQLVGRGTNDRTPNCSIWDSSWALAMILCMAIILLGMLISNCIICLSLGRQKAQVQSATLATQIKSSDQQDGDEVVEAPRRKTRRKSRQINYDNTEALNYRHFQEQPEIIQIQEQQQPKRSHHHHKATLAPPVSRHNKQYT